MWGSKLRNKSRIAAKLGTSIPTPKVEQGQSRLEAMLFSSPLPPSPHSLSAGEPSLSPPFPSPPTPPGGVNSNAHRPASLAAPLPCLHTPLPRSPPLSPPHSSMLTPGTSTTRTTSSYFSPNMAVAPPALASVSPITRVCTWSRSMAGQGVGFQCEGGCPSTHVVCVWTYARSQARLGG